MICVRLIKLDFPVIQSCTYIDTEEIVSTDEFIMNTTGNCLFGEVKHACYNQIYSLIMDSYCITQMWLTTKDVLGWSTLFHASCRTVELNFALLISLNDGGRHDGRLVTVGTLHHLSACLDNNTFQLNANSSALDTPGSGFNIVAYILSIL